MPLSCGDKLGPYEILAPIGVGGMGEVWKARDTRLDRIVAIKTSSEKFSERFEREARAIAALNHPNICQIYDVGPDYLVMEYVEGSEIKGPLPFDLALKAAIQLAGALEAAHRKSITHRDLKPANILSTKSGVKVLDFGLAKFEVLKPKPDEATQTRALTEEGSIVGTLQYMAPEQLQGKPTDTRSDIFSFGCVLYEILTGKRAFHAESKASLIAAIMDRDPEPLALNKPALERIVRTCLAKDPDDRWQSASDLKRELEWILESGSSAGMPATVLKSRRLNPGWVLSGILAVLLAAGAVVHFRTASEPAEMIRFEVPLPEGTHWGFRDYPVLSPDGSRILFPTIRGTTRSFWVRVMNSVNAQPVQQIEGPISYSGPGSWSPDGRSIVYVADRKLHRFEMNSGSLQILGSMFASPLSQPSWSPAGVILFSTEGEAIPRLGQIPATGGEAKPAMALGRIELNPSFLPDGRRFLYSSVNGSAGIGNAIYIGALDAKEGKRLATGSSGVFVPPSWILYVRGSTLVAQMFDSAKEALTGATIPIADQVAVVSFNGGGFSVSQNGVLAYRRAPPEQNNDLTWYDRQGKRLGTVGEPAIYSNPALSPDGKRLAISRLDLASNTRNIWVMDLVRGTSSRFTFEKADHLNPVWSPDGSRIAFSSPRKSETIRDLYWKSASGAGTEEAILEDSGNKSLENWSPDGKFLLFNLNLGTEIDAVPIGGDRKPFPVLKSSFSQDHASVSPDGRWIAYSSQESGRREVFVQNFPLAGGKWQISTNGGTEPSWRRDGKELYFMEGIKLVAVEVKASGSSFDAGIPKELFKVPEVATLRRNNYVPTADGQRFLFITTQTGEDTQPFVVVQNWQSALKH
jgi:serine/threonine protein kinase